MQEKQENKPAKVVKPQYKELPPSYKPLDASKYDLRLIQRLFGKRR